MVKQTQGRVSRRAFLQGLGALALSALPACRRAQVYAVQPEECPEWAATAGEFACFASAMPWAAGAYPLLAVCSEGVPVALQPNPLYTAQAGLPAHVQAALIDLYSPKRPRVPTFGGKPTPWAGVRSSFRAWARALQEGRRAGFLFPCGYSAVREAQICRLRELPGVSCFAYDPVAAPRAVAPEPLAAMQEAALGKAVVYDTSCGSLAELTAQLAELDLLFIFAPSDPAALDATFAQALEQCTAETVRFSLQPADETGKRCLYTVPQTHFLEEWGAEADAYGNLCLRQPVTMPLVTAWAEAEALHALLHDGALPAEERTEPSAALSWVEQVCPNVREALKRGYVPAAAPLPHAQPASPSAQGYLHPFFVDGRNLHNVWLREAYDPLSGTAGAPAVYLPGAADTPPAAARVMGYTLPVAYLPGLEAPLLPLLPGLAAGARLEIEPRNPYPTHKRRPLPPDAAATPPVRGKCESPQWGLVIDYSRCVGCAACTVACRAENNVPVVGTEEQRRGRDLQWLRIESYCDSSGRLSFVPATCRQCRNAPCEAVCPVNATVHTGDGLNAMVYPRCWGTRYCAAACPYQARTFNYYDYAATARAATALPPNPQVTVRSRGVMEKCSCCVQRLQAARLSGSATPPRTACQMACPRGAIRLIDWASEPPPPGLTARFDAPGTQPATVYACAPAHDTP